MFTAVTEISANAFRLSPEVLTMLWIGIGIYILTMLLIGWWSNRQIGTLSDFLVAGRRLPLWMATATLLATWFGAGSSMGVAAQVYSSGIGGVLADPFGASLSLLIAGIFIVGMLRKMKCLTVTDIIARRYGEGAGAYAALWMVPVYIGWLGAQLLGIGHIMNMLTGWPVAAGTIIGAAVVLCYTFAGGMWAVTLTDVVQVSLIIIGLVLILPLAIGEAGGHDAMLKTLSSADLTLWIPPAAEGASRTMNDWSYYIGSWIIMGLGCAVGQDVIQRSLSSKNEKIAISSSVISGLLYMMIGVIPVIIGFAARIVLPKYGISAESMGNNAENQVLPLMAAIVLGNMHPILLTVFLSALVAAIMSSADSSLLAGSSLLCNNVLRPLFPKISDGKLLVTTRTAAVVLSAVSLFLALNVESIYALMINSWASQLVVVFLPVVTAIYVPKASCHCAWSAMTISTIVWIGYCFWGSLGSGMAFTELMNSDLFKRTLTCGAVYGFVAGILAFTCAYLGERLTARLDAGD